MEEQELIGKITRLKGSIADLKQTLATQQGTINSHTERLKEEFSVSMEDATPKLESMKKELTELEEKHGPAIAALTQKLQEV